MSDQTTPHASDGKVRVRFAPSPTGYLHIGGARTALFNWLLARGSGGAFVLRIEDTDRERSTPEATQVILDGMRYLGLDWDEGPEVGGEYGPYFQTERDAVHREMVDQLLAAGKAYRCFCSKERLTELREGQEKRKERRHYDRRCFALLADEIESRVAAGEPSVVRFRVPEGSTVVDDLIRGRVSIDCAEIEDFIIARADGTPVYNLAVVADDHGMGITHVVRGEDHLTNTPKQVLIFEALGLPVPQYGHMSLTLGPDGGKLSKRHAKLGIMVAVREYEEKGYLPEAMINFLVRLGWSYDDKTEIFSRDELIKLFSLDRVVKSGAVYDLKKLNHLGAHYMRERPADEVVAMAIPHLVRAGLVSEGDAAEGGAQHERIRRMVALAKDRVSFVAEIVDAVRYYFEDPQEPDKGAKKGLRKKKNAVPLVKRWAEKLDADFPGDGWGLDDHEALEAHATAFLEAEGAGLGDLAQPVRAMVSGRGATPGLFEVLAILGKKTCLERLARIDDWVVIATS